MTTKKHTLTLLQHHHELTNAIACDRQLPRQIKTLLVGISTFFNLSNQCAFPSRAQISKRTGYCTNHITTLIKQAVEMGVLVSTPQYVLVPGETAPRQISNKYEFVLESFGLFFSKAKALLNRNLRQKSTNQATNEREAKKRIDHIDTILNDDSDSLNTITTLKKPTDSAPPT